MNFFSKTNEDHIKHLRQTFVKCINLGISLNPKMSYFSMEEGNILGHIVSKEGVKIDPERLEVIKKFAQPRNKKDVQHLLGKIGFLRGLSPISPKW